MPTIQLGAITNQEVNVPVVCVAHAVDQILVGTVTIVKEHVVTASHSEKTDSNDLYADLNVTSNKMVAAEKPSDVFIKHSTHTEVE